MGGLGRRQTTVLVAVGGVFILAAGFLVGRAIGNSDNTPSIKAEAPTEISTREGTVAIPTLGDAERIPTLEVPREPAEPDIEEEAVEEAPSLSPVEAESPSPTPESAPEVTVAPNG